MISIPQLLELVQPFQKFFTKPARLLFENIIEGWILAPCCRFATSIYQFGDPKRFRAYC